MCPKYSECSHVSVNFLRILAHMGVEARENQYNQTEVRTFCIFIHNINHKTDEAMGYNR